MAGHSVAKRGIKGEAGMVGPPIFRMLLITTPGFEQSSLVILIGKGRQCCNETGDISFVHICKTCALDVSHETNKRLQPQSHIISLDPSPSYVIPRDTHSLADKGGRSDLIFTNHSAGSTPVPQSPAEN